MPGYWAYAATLMFTGFAVVTMLTTANGYVQTTTDPALRGRVLALYMAILMGGTPIGAPIVGWVAAEFGPRVGDPRRRRRCARRIRDRRHVAAGLRHGCTADESRRFRLTIDETLPIPVVATATGGLQRSCRVDDADPDAARRPRLGPEAAHQLIRPGPPCARLAAERTA